MRIQSWAARTRPSSTEEPSQHGSVQVYDAPTASAEDTNVRAAPAPREAQIPGSVHRFSSHHQVGADPAWGEGALPGAPWGGHRVGWWWVQGPKQVSRSQAGMGQKLRAKSGTQGLRAADADRWGGIPKREAGGRGVMDKKSLEMAAAGDSRT